MENHHLNERRKPMLNQCVLTGKQGADPEVFLQPRRQSRDQLQHRLPFVDEKDGMDQGGMCRYRASVTFQGQTLQKERP
jgi:hypothetical protein